MGITPTTKAQVSGHRFLTRRIEHGLVLGDIRMIHDPLASRKRAQTFGLTATGIVCLGAIVLALLKPAIDPGDASIIRSESGQLYVRIDDQLHPVANLASARLIVGEAADVQDSSDRILKDLPKAVPVGILDAPGLVAPPDSERQELVIHACHTVGVAASRLDSAPSEVTVLLQESAARSGFSALGADRAVLAAVDQAEWLVGADGRRLLPPADTPVGRNIRHRLGITPSMVRWMPPPQLFSAIVERAPIAVPPGVSEVLRIPGAREPQLWARIFDGVVRLTPVQADILIDAGVYLRDGTATELGQDPDSKALAALPLPDRVPTWVDPTAQPLCVGDDGGVAVAGSPGGSGPADSGWGETIALAGAAVATRFSGPGWAVGVDTGSGVHVVSAHGLRHQVADRATVETLGISHLYSISWDILRLLPSGTTLSKEQALRPLY
ncbi:MAG: type VII secretion protein EccB [Corynebacterium sp.]|nr:type VII secretion protein EccB [Corynebacterium sp.]